MIATIIEKEDVLEVCNTHTKEEIATYIMNIYERMYRLEELWHKRYLQQFERDYTEYNGALEQMHLENVELIRKLKIALNFIKEHDLFEEFMKKRMKKHRRESQQRKKGRTELMSSKLTEEHLKMYLEY